ncbi:MAG: hypothetical protein R3B47_10555 [Bacteroidia bacterium]
MMRIPFTRLLIFGLANILWCAGMLGQVTVTPTSPYLETFDNYSNCSHSATAACAFPTGSLWTNVNSSRLWRSATTNTGSSPTGPNRDFTTCGTGTCNTSQTAIGAYLYTESSSPAVVGDVYEVVSPTFNISALSSPVLTFYYHLNGTSIGTFEVIVDNGTTQTVALTYSGQQQTSESDPWRKAQVLLCGYGNSVSVHFKHTLGADGSTYFWGDAGIDQVEVFDAAAAGPDLELVALTAPVPGTLCASFTSSEQVTVTIKNNTCTAFNFATTPVSFSLSGTGPITPSASFTLNSGTLGGNQSQTVNIGSLNMSATGIYVFDVSANMVGDGNSANNSITNATFKSGTITTFPYAENFENGDGGWETQGTTTFAIGSPSGSVINQNAPGGGTKSWVTNPGGLYSTNENGAVVSPCFNMSSLTNPVIQFDAWWNSEVSWDGTVLQYSTNGGQAWNNVGILNDPNAENWYNDNSLDGRAGGQNIGWSGNPGSGGWLSLEYTMPFLGGQSSVIFRFAFGSDGSVQYDGFAFDNIFILEAPLYDAAAISVEPSSICPGSLDVLMTIKNRGVNNLSSVRISADVDGNSIVSNQLVSFSPALQRGEEKILVVGQYTFQGSTTHTVNASVSQPNGQVDQNPLNNSTSSSASFKTGVISSFPYIENFENGAGNWETQGSTSFAIGTPSGSIINGNPPGGGTKSWVTNPAGNYNNNENGAVVSPCFNFSSLAVPAIQFNAWFNSEVSWDGTVLQYSTDGGETWQNLGTYLDTAADNWYNDNSLDGRAGGQSIGWSGSQIGRVGLT